MPTVLCTRIQSETPGTNDVGRYVCWDTGKPDVHLTSLPVVGDGIICYRIHSCLAEMVVCLKELCSVRLPQMHCIWKPGMHMYMTVRPGHCAGLRSSLEQLKLPDELTVEALWELIMPQVRKTIMNSLTKQYPDPMSWIAWEQVQRRISETIMQSVGIILYRNGLEPAGQITPGEYPMPV